MIPARTVRRLAGVVVGYLREVSGEAEFERLCKEYENTETDGARLSLRARRGLWRAYSAGRARETNRCC
ncbi:hypothetical protein [Streptomyces decoyicus]|uniref:hypothetical protein n=1 Tax=Streptomyces decoyicus TaxID=249567 RepID=UPI003867BAF9